MTKTIQNSRMRLNKETETRKKTQAEMKMKLKNTVTQLENVKKALKLGRNKQKTGY